MSGTPLPLPTPSPPEATAADGARARAADLLWGGPRAAFALLSRVPVGAGPLSAAAQRWSPAFFPLVGLGLGGAAGAVLVLARPLLGDWVAACLALLTLVVCTGALHEDGLADTADALGAGGGPERIRAILKDSRIGTFGAVALGLFLLLRVGLLVRLSALAPLAVVIAAVLSRTAPVGLLAVLPYVTPGPSAKNRQVANTGWRQMSLAAVLAAGVLLAAFGLGGFSPLALGAAVLATVVVTVAAGNLFRRRLGGVTGDFLGATQQATEVVVLLVLAVSWPIFP